MNLRFYFLVLTLELIKCSASCDDVDFMVLPSSPPHACVMEATRSLPAAFIRYPNQSCRLFAVCSSLTKWPCPIYTPFPTDRKIILLRTLAGSAPSPYDLLINDKLFSDYQWSDERISKSNQWFKSPLLKSSQLSLSQIQFQLFDGTKEVVRLVFKVSDDDGPVSKGKWFAKKRLIVAYPWSVANLKADSVYFFSFVGQHKHSTRRFYINERHKGCNADRGFLAIVSKAVCGYEAFKVPIYLWTANGKEVGIRISQSKRATELRIHGIFKNTGAVMSRSNTC